MRVLTSSVLVMEAIILGLAIPVALVASDLPTWFGWLLAGLALVALLLPGLARRPLFVPAGWALQVAVLLCGIAEPMLLMVGVPFAALWWTALHLGRKVEASQASQASRASQAPPA
jgi:hypothetical protein